MTQPVRRALTAIVWILLIALAWTGVNGGVRDWPHAHSVGQRVQSVLQGLYGVLAIACLAVPSRGPWARLVPALFVASCTLAAGLAVTVWGEASWGMGFLAGVGAFVVSAGLVLSLRALRASA